MNRQFFLIDLLKDASIEAPHEGYVQVQPVTVKRETRTSLFQHPNSKVTFASIALPRNCKTARLSFGCALKQVCWSKFASPVRFNIWIVAGNRERNLFDVVVDPHQREFQKWHDYEIDLTPFRRESSLSLVFQTSVDPGQEASYCWSAWSDPCIDVQEQKTVSLFGVKASSVSVSQNRNKHVLLISSDALRADHLGCYGHPYIRTPNVDELARQGILCSDARAQSPTTLGSYATLFTSLYAREHGLMAEWGRIQSGITTLPQVLAEHGYHTLIAASERELVDDWDGFSRHFSQSIPCLGVPSQGGNVTARQFTQWLANRPDKPFFAWVQLFDTHPPSTPPAPFNSMYYQNNPSDPITKYGAEKVAAIRGMESVLRIEAALPALQEGLVDIDLLRRLDDTARFLTGEIPYGPDLVHQLPAIGMRAMRGLEPHDFGNWLKQQVTQLKQNVVTAEIIHWLEAVLEPLKEVEQDVLSWLDDVHDFRYPLSQYEASVSYADQQVGTIIDALKKEGIYDDTLIVFTSPHGEMLDESGLLFHHHVLADQVLNVPLIIKPFRNDNHHPGKRLSGFFNHVDLAPSILSALGLPIPSQFRGADLWRTSIHEYTTSQTESFAVDIHAATVSLATAKYTYMKALSTYIVSPCWRWRAQQDALFERTQPARYDENLAEMLPEVATTLRSRTDEFLREIVETTAKHPSGVATINS